MGIGLGVQPVFLFPNVVLSSITVTDDLILLACETCENGVNAAFSGDIGPGWIKVYDRSDMRLLHSIEGESPLKMRVGAALTVNKDTDRVYKVWYSTAAIQGELTLRSIYLTHTFNEDPSIAWHATSNDSYLTVISGNLSDTLLVSSLGSEIYIKALKDAPSTGLQVIENC